MASIKKRGNKWYVRVSQRTKDGLTQINENFYTKGEAETWAKETELALKRGNNPQMGKQSFSKFFETWYETYKEHTISPATKKNYEITKRIINDYFKDLELNQIDELKYQEFINWYAFGEKKRNKETVDKLNVHCKACFKKAVKLGYIRYNPAEDVKSTGIVSNKLDNTMALDELEIKQLIAAMLKDYDKDNPNIPLLFNLVSIAYGPRFSENSALTWDNIYWDGRIKIDKSWDFNTNHFKPTKTQASNRIVAIDDFTIKLLRELREWQVKNGIHYKNLVFIDYNEKPYSNNGINKSLRKYLKLANINKPNISHHNLRHSHITWLLNKKKNLKYVSRRAGHETVITTMEKYNHVLDAIEQSEDQEVKIMLMEQFQ